jgi:hypothetical protein
MKINFCLIVFIILMLGAVNFVEAEIGYKLWLKYDLISDTIIYHGISN